MILLNLYLKRTSQTLSSFVDSNMLYDVVLFEKKCHDLGVSHDAHDMLAFKAILKAKKQQKKNDVVDEQVPTVKKKQKLSIISDQ